MHNTSRSVAIIDLGAMGHNLAEVKRLARDKKIIAMVKGNAYGHGLVGTATFLADKVDYFGVAFVEEAIELRENGIKTPILVFNPTLPEQFDDYFKYNIDHTVASISALQNLDTKAKKRGIEIKVHLKIDTGMMRLGIRYTNAQNLLRKASEVKNSQVVSVFSHFATSDEENLDFANLQLERFKKVIKFYDEQKQKPLFHMANSAAIIRLPESHFDMVRPGIMMYGYHPSEFTRSCAKLCPALTWKAKATYFKVILKDHPVSYGGTWVAPENVRAVTIPIGYADGFRRMLSNKGDVLIRGKKYSVIGNVCMDQTVIKIGEGEAYKGDDVVIIGKQGDQEITAEDMAAKLDTISYEVLTGIMKRVERVYV